MGKKKSRKVGQIGIPKSNIPREITTVEKPKMKNGKKPGSRQQTVKTKTSELKTPKNPKLGSKTPIDLGKYTARYKSKRPDTAPSTIKYKTPHDEIAAIENDSKLDLLLEKQAEQTLSQAELAYVTKLTNRYQQLCDLVGIEIEPESKENEQDVDPFASLDAIKLEDFKD